MFATATETSDLNVVHALEKRRVAAMRANDADALEPLLHEQLIYVNSAGEIYDKQAYLNGLRTHAVSYDSDFDFRQTESRELDDVIILAGLMLGHSRLDGEQQVFFGYCVWRRIPANGGCWLAVVVGAR